MLLISRWKSWAIALICMLGILFALPNVVPSSFLDHMPRWLQNRINLGLELRGGSHLQLEVDLKAVIQEYLHSLMDDLRLNLRKEGIGYVNLSLDSKKSPAVLTFTLRNLDQIEKVKALIQKIDPSLTVEVGGDGFVSITMLEETLKTRNKKLVEQSIEVIRKRVDETGTKEPVIQRQGSDRIILQLPGVDDPKEIKNQIGKTAKMTFHLVDENTQPVVPKVKGIPPSERAPLGVEYLPEDRRDGHEIYLPVFKKVSLSGDLLIDAQVSIGENGLPCVSLKFNSLGAKKFAKISSENLKKRFAVVLDNRIVTAPAFQSVIPNGEATITGSFDVKEANELALLLRAGALPAPLKVVEEKTVGPSLGADSIRDGQIATILAFVLVSVFMIMSYSLFGFFADIALFFNLVFLFAGLSLLQATLTLPGIAGIALTIGMAVDANVLIYERIKEELRLGAKPVIAIDVGYRRAMTTIIDSNLTTLAGAAVLFEFGTGPIRGFAITLALGILISLFTALSLTRLIIVKWLQGRRLEKLPI